MEVELEADRLQSLMGEVLEELGLDVESNPHLLDTPRRVAASLRELITPVEFEFTVFDNRGIDQMIVVQDIPFYSLCAHHLLPFYGKAHVAYIPADKMAGISKIARAVEYFMRGLNVQEELTKDIMDFLVEKLDPLGAIVVIEGHHLCMAMRGVESRVHKTTTSALTGVFLRPDKRAREEFFQLIGRSNGSG
jgi:GTP cyclohydrolase I